MFLGAVQETAVRRVEQDNAGIEEAQSADPNTYVVQLADRFYVWHVLLIFKSFAIHDGKAN